MKKSFQDLIRKTLKSLVKEIDAVITQEKSLKHALTLEQSRLRGIRLPECILDTDYCKFCGKDVEICLQHGYNLTTTWRTFRPGKLVNVVLSAEAEAPPKWASIKGVVSKIEPGAVFVQVEKVGNNFLGPFLSKRTQDDICILDLEQRSTCHLLQDIGKVVKSLKLSRRNEAIAAKLINQDEQNSNLPSCGMTKLEEKWTRDIFGHQLDQDKFKALKLVFEKVSQ